ncbi:hypothetical protein OG394_07110 [Kribbella sp. NBC_01245]|uniref:hypothetical protein n=1 Tax=Kribbella sp. NBC_01245 TaxID=2903578 RepID=UPI002E289939|nr:hypothetical protein [Kribbella sp. NBC_01245]
MSIRRTVIRGLALAGVAATTAVMAPGANAAPAREAGPTAVTGANASICKAYAGTVRGCAYFRAYDELLIACDRRGDGRSVYAQLYWNGAIRAQVKDRNGATSGCYGLDLSLPEGKAVWVRTYVQGVGFSSWRRGTA